MMFWPKENADAQEFNRSSAEAACYSMWRFGVVRKDYRTALPDTSGKAERLLCATSSAGCF